MLIFIKENYGFYGRKFQGVREGEVIVREGKERRVRKQLEVGKGWAETTLAWQGIIEKEKGR